MHRRGWLEYAAWTACVLVAAGVAHTLITNENYQWDVVGKYFTASTVLRGLRLTIILTVVVMFFGTILAMGIAVMRASSIRPVRLLASAYITFFRGTPVLVQLIFWFNIAALYPNIAIGIPFTDVSHAVDVNKLLSATTAAIIGLSLNVAAYLAEIIRGGFASVDRGQIEAADSLGMSSATKLRRIIIPQAMPTIIPATGNQVIGMFKETSLVSVLGVAELLQSTQLIYARTYQTIPLLIVACLWYLIMTLALSYPQSLIEKKYSMVRSRVSNQPVILDDVLVEGGTMNGEAAVKGDGTVYTRGLRKCYGDRVVLDSIDLDVACGEIVCIIGPSGSGKSTLLRVVDGLEEADRGVLRVNGEDLGFIETEDVIPSPEPGRGRGAAHPDRDGVPAVQPVPEHDCPGERDVRAGAGQGRTEEAGCRAC